MASQLPTSSRAIGAAITAQKFLSDYAVTAPLDPQYLRRVVSEKKINAGREDNF